LNQQGEIFSPQNANEQVHLPSLFGPDGSSQEVMEQYQEFNQLLFAHGLRISNLNLNSRGAWSMTLGNGLHINVGRDRELEKLRRFTRVMDNIFMGQLPAIHTVDLRYNNGIAVRKNEFGAEDIHAL